MASSYLAAYTPPIFTSFEICDTVQLVLCQDLSSCFQRSSSIQMEIPSSSAILRDYILVLHHNVCEGCTTDGVSVSMLFGNLVSDTSAARWATY